MTLLLYRMCACVELIRFHSFSHDLHVYPQVWRFGPTLLLIGTYLYFMRGAGMGGGGGVNSVFRIGTRLMSSLIQSLTCVCTLRQIHSEEDTERKRPREL
jgi:hypothetical protein